MPFQVSPGVNVTEIDLTTIVPAVSTTEGAVAGVFRWGPVDKTVLIDNEDKLAVRFGKPTNHNPETFFTAANFLAYGNKLYVSRAANTTGSSNVESITIESGNTIIETANSDTASVGDLVIGAGIPEGTTIFAANSTAIVLTKEPTSSATDTFIFLNPTAVFSAVANASSLSTSDELAQFVVKNEDDYLTKSELFPSGSSVEYIAKYPGATGNSLKISVCDSATAFSSNVGFPADGATIANSAAISNGGITIAVGSNTATLFLTNTAVFAIPDSDAGAANALITHVTTNFLVGDVLRLGNNTIGFQDIRITSVNNNTAVSTAGNTTITIGLESAFALSTNFFSNTVARNWEYYINLDKAPGQSDYVKKFGNTAANDELHIIVADEDGKITGVPGTILEVFRGLSRASDAKTEDGAVLYYKTVINDNSNYVWFAKDRSGAVTNTALSVVTSTNIKPMSLSFNGGTDGANEDTVAISVLTTAYDNFKSAEDIDVSLILQGKARGGTNGQQLANYIIDNIVDFRKDCVAFVSPDRADVVNNIGKDEAQDIVTFRNSLSSTSYAVLDSGYKYQYDKYNDVYRYVPLNGDIAGLAVRTDNVRDPWFSPAGFNRGQIKNIIKLAYNPAKADRDILYKSDINPVCIFPGQGTVLFGDKTLLGRPSSFDRINVRRLFIVLEKAIATAAKFTLFEFNDEFTRAQFKNLVEPFLRDVQGRRGIFDFRVICDETNNTGEVIDRNEFVGDIYIKPARAINFIQLNFVAVRTGVEFSEVVGKF